MNEESFFATTKKRKGILFDPRTKLVLLLTITTLMFSTSNTGIMNIVKPCLSLIPFVLILSERRFKTAGKYLLLYAVCFVLERIALTVLSGLLSFIVLAITSIMTRFAPGIMTGAWLISSTSVSEFIAAMERMHITEKNAGNPFRRKKSFFDGRIQACTLNGIRCEDWRRTFCRRVNTGAWCPRQTYKCMSDWFSFSRCDSYHALHPMFYSVFVSAANCVLKGGVSL